VTYSTEKPHRGESHATNRPTPAANPEAPTSTEADHADAASDNSADTLAEMAAPGTALPRDEPGFTPAEAEHLAIALELASEGESHANPQAALVHLIVCRQAIERSNGGNHDDFARLAEKVAELSQEGVDRLFGHPVPGHPVGRHHSNSFRFF
jgi:hypothetical protein